MIFKIDGLIVLEMGHKSKWGFLSIELIIVGYKCATSILRPADSAGKSSIGTFLAVFCSKRIPKFSYAY